MSIRLLVAAGVIATLPSCFQLELQAHAGYANLAVDGNLGYQDGGAVGSIDQDVESAFGLGDEQGTPMVRAELDTGVQVLSVSGFVFDDEGQGVLQAQFGDEPLLSVGAPVNTQFDLTNIKGSYLFDIGLGPVTLSPGIAIDYFDLDMAVSDVFGIVTEDVELQAPIPLAMVRGEVELGPVRARAEVGYMAVEVDDVDGSMLDAEAMIYYQPVSMLDLFAGYRHLNLAVDGEIDGDAFDTDITIAGWVIGGGIRF